MDTIDLLRSLTEGVNSKVNMDFLAQDDNDLEYVVKTSLTKKEKTVVEDNGHKSEEIIEEKKLEKKEVALPPKQKKPKIDRQGNPFRRGPRKKKEVPVVEEQVVFVESEVEEEIFPDTFIESEGSEDEEIIDESLIYPEKTKVVGIEEKDIVELEESSNSNDSDDLDDDFTLFQKKSSKNSFFDDLGIDEIEDDFDLFSQEKSLKVDSDFDSEDIDFEKEFGLFEDVDFEDSVVEDSAADESDADESDADESDAEDVESDDLFEKSVVELEYEKETEQDVIIDAFSENKDDILVQLNKDSASSESSNFEDDFYDNFDDIVEKLKVEESIKEKPVDENYELSCIEFEEDLDIDFTKILEEQKKKLEVEAVEAVEIVEPVEPIVDANEEPFFDSEEKEPFITVPIVNVSEDFMIDDKEETDEELSDVVENGTFNNLEEVGDLEDIKDVEVVDDIDDTEDTEETESEEVEDAFKNCVYHKGMDIEEYLKENPKYREAFYVEHFYNKDYLNQMLNSGLILMKKGKYFL